MKSLFLITGSNEVPKYAKSLENLKLGEVGMIAYDGAGSTDKNLYGQVKSFAPDLVVYIGGVFGPQPSISTLARINAEIAPSVHICSDAADAPWWPLLREYHAGSAFSLQVAIDGNKKWPLGSSQMTALTPVDPLLFPSVIRPHHERSIVFGYAGNPGSGGPSIRTQILSKFLEKRILDLRIRSNLPHTYEAFCTYLAGIRISLNIAYSGTEQTTHVKGRVLESALAGACLLETKGSPTSNWFKPGVDYLEYSTPEEAAEIVAALASDPMRTQTMGESLRQRVLKEHSPALFWQRIFARIGINATAAG